MRLARALSALLAVVVCAWFVLGARQAHEVNAAGNLMPTSPPFGGRAALRAQSLLDAASDLNPDRSVQVLQGQLALVRGEPHRAQAILEAVVRSEPLNIDAWAWLAHSAGSDRKLYLSALDHIRQLDPFVTQGA
jgi:hypothetical protein